MLTLPSSVKIFIHAQPTDMRCGFNKLSMLTETIMGKDPLSGHLFVFFNKRGDKCKILFWDRTGFIIWYKRLEEGTFEKLQASPGSQSLEIDVANRISALSSCSRSGRTNPVLFSIRSKPI